MSDARIAEWKSIMREDVKFAYAADGHLANKIFAIDLPNDYKCCYIVPISDTHIGDPLFDEKKLIGYLNWIKSEPKARVILVGDIMNAAIIDSVSNIYESTMNPHEQLDVAKKWFMPIKDRIIGVVSGNHEQRIWRKTGIDVSRLMAESLGALYEPIALGLKIRLGQFDSHKNKFISYVIYATHGWGGGKKPGGKANNLWSLAEETLADVYIMSHNHFMMTFQDIYKVPDTRNNNYIEMKRTYASSGSYLKWGGYAQGKGFAPAKEGSPRIRLEGINKKDVHVSI